MEANIGTISLGKRSFGAVTSLSTADVNSLITSTTNLVKKVAIVGGGALIAAKFLGLLDSHARAEIGDAPKVALGSTLVRISDHWKQTWGVLLDEQVSFKDAKGDGQYSADLSVVSRVQLDFDQPSMFSALFADEKVSWHTSIQTVDGSMYQRMQPTAPGAFRACTMIGNQEFAFAQNQKSSMSIRPASFTDVDTLKARLTEALQHNLADIIQLIGEKTFAQFFKLKQPS